MITERPYFMENKDWYEFTDEGVVLTDKATKEAKESYEEYKKTLEEFYKEYE